ncbi:uncharacterized protein BP5553_10649 [Venustampulla echinocandica]|uniref:Phospholipase/carboxylesterase/thioesterase domain-containing protein n=1 Tax=Venustampulla echinocandica TaxID=2656787 RepID=A0A370T8P7_9HELO|nr:uncharacterized protein BP5553_10649 [Venustampulla echinocandica]RDL29784.1 hypothetical protein BP5553_10649 [Venustampulla echinocandica]
MASSYPAPFIISPTPPNTHQTTLILLHGTSTTGPEFASSFLSFPFPQPQPKTNTPITLQQALPNTKFVFPTGKLRKTTVFGGRETNAWFDVSDFGDRTIGEDAMRGGIRESIVYLTGIVEDEVKLLEPKSECDEDGQGRGDRSGRVVLGGFSQGSAMGVMLILSRMLEARGLAADIGGFTGLSGWCPFRLGLEESIFSGILDGDASIEEGYEGRREKAASYLRQLIDIRIDGNEEEGCQGESLLDKKIFLAHGKEDAKMKIEWGAQMRDLLKTLGGDVWWEAYVGLGHWYGEEEMKDLVSFLEGVWGGTAIRE